VNNIGPYIEQSKKIFWTWFKHMMYVFVTIIVVFFNTSFGRVLELLMGDPFYKNLKVQAYETRVKWFWEAFTTSIANIAFFLIFLLLFLLFYTICVIIRIVKRIVHLPFNWTIGYLLFWLILASSIFSGLVCYISHSLGCNYTAKGFLFDIIWRNLWLQSIIILSTLLIYKSLSTIKWKYFYPPWIQKIQIQLIIRSWYLAIKAEKKKIVLVLFVGLLFCFLIYWIWLWICNNLTWIRETTEPFFRYFYKTGREGSTWKKIIGIVFNINP